MGSRALSCWRGAARHPTLPTRKSWGKLSPSQGARWDTQELRGQGRPRMDRVQTEPISGLAGCGQRSRWRLGGGHCSGPRRPGHVSAAQGREQQERTGGSHGVRAPRPTPPRSAPANPQRDPQARRIPGRRAPPPAAPHLTQLRPPAAPAWAARRAELGVAHPGTAHRRGGARGSAAGD